MKNKKLSKLRKLVERDKWLILILSILSLLTVGGSFTIYYIKDYDSFWGNLAEFLMNIGETIIGIGLIGGIINFIYEESRAEEVEAEEKKKEYQENREKRKLFRKDIQNRLKYIQDNVELARILIKSHKSGKTYGEQIRQHIIPSLISLKEIKRELNYTQDRQLKKNLDYLRVSLTYMIGYLRVLIEEFEASYIDISNLQTYQDALAEKMRTSFTEVAEGQKSGATSIAKKKEFLESAEKKFADSEIPSNIEVVWQAFQELDYIWDFIDDLRDDEGVKSLYYQYFLEHNFHCNNIIKTDNNSINKKLVSEHNFVENMKEIKRIVKKKDSDSPLTKRDSLTRKVMENELQFDFENSKMKVLK